MKPKHLKLPKRSIREITRTATPVEKTNTIEDLAERSAQRTIAYTGIQSGNTPFHLQTEAYQRVYTGAKTK
jgi:hypothetical protein